MGLILVIQMFIFPTYLKDEFNGKIAEHLVITNETQATNSTAYLHWLSNTFQDSAVVLLKYTLFNVTNPYEVMNGSYPKLEPIGPFTYNRYEYRTAVKFSSDSTKVNYTYEYEFVFNEEESSSNFSLDDFIITINPALLTLANTAAQFPIQVFYTIINSLNASHIFYFTTPRQVLWGVIDHDFDTLVHTYTGQPLNSTSFHFANYDSNNVEEYTGKGEKSKMRELIMYTNVTSMNFWQEPELVSGHRETKQFPYDYITTDTELAVWSQEKFRGVTYVYDETVTKNKLNLYRFRMADYEPLNATNYAPNAQFYQLGQDGLWNITAKSSIPKQTIAYVSKPYFLDGDYYVDNVGVPMGLREPVRSIDDSYFDVEPYSGIVFDGNVNYQLNLQLFNFSGNFTKLPNVIVPFGIVSANAYAQDSTINDFASNLNFLQTVQYTSIYGGPSFAAICFALSIWLMCRRKQFNEIEKKDKLMEEYDEKESEEGDIQPEVVDSFHQSQIHSNITIPVTDENVDNDSHQDKIIYAKNKSRISTDHSKYEKSQPLLDQNENIMENPNTDPLTRTMPVICSPVKDISPLLKKK